MTPEKIVENHKKYVLQSWSKQGNLNPIPVAKADGIYFYDFDGNRYTDMSSQLVNLNLGYGNKAIGDAIIGVKAIWLTIFLQESLNRHLNEQFIPTKSTGAALRWTT